MRHEFFDLKIATWNVNGIKARLEGVADWLKQTEPDIVCLQEIKSVDENFPGEAFQSLGYNIATHGQKGFNGVAIFSKYPFESVDNGLEGDATDEQARFVSAVIGSPAGPVQVACAYMPNGNPMGTEKYRYKLSWMERLQVWAASALQTEMPLLLAGDYNIIPEPEDAKNPQAWEQDALYQDETRAHFRKLANLGFTDGIRAVNRDSDLYTFWDFQGGAWQKNNGIRIDHILLAPEAKDRLVCAGIDKFTRAWERPSDHVPVWVELD